MRPILATPLVLLGIVSSAHALDLGLHVARVSANEGALFHRQETALVWQVVRSNSKPNVWKQDEFLTRHSPRVSLQKPCFGGNCRWSPYMNRQGVQPPGMALKADLWELKVRPIWLDVLAYADWIVRGQRKSEDPCPIPPRTWGGAMDREKAIRDRDLYPIGCAMHCGHRDTCDDGFALQADCWVNGYWICDPLYAPVVASEPEVLACSH